MAIMSHAARNDMVVMTAIRVDTGWTSCTWPSHVSRRATMASCLNSFGVVRRGGSGASQTAAFLSAVTPDLTDQSR